MSVTHVRYEVLSTTGFPLGRELHPMTPATISCDHGARTMTGLRLDPAETEPALNERVRPVWVDMATGAETSRGHYLYRGGQLRLGAGGVGVECYPLPDRLDLLRWPPLDPYGIEPGDTLTEAARLIAIAAGFTDDELDVEPNGQTLGDAPLAFATDRLSGLDAICKLLGYLPPHVDDDGTLVLRSIPQPLTTLPARTDLSVGDDATIWSGTLATNPPSTLSPNILVVRSTSATGAPVRGRWIGPAGQANSVENIGELPVFIDVAGLETDAQADLIAAAMAKVHLAIGTTDTYTTDPIPGAGIFDVVRRDGTNKLEVAWAHQLSPGAAMTHVLSEAYPDA